MDQEVTDVLADLVRIRSVNPADGDASVGGRNETEVAAYVRDYLARLGLEPQVQEVAPHRVNIYAATEGAPSEPVLLFEAHTDTVPAETWDGDAWDPQVRDGRMYGRGACDCKGALAAMLVALRRLLALGRRRYGVMMLAACDEESGMGGARGWVRLGIPARFAVVGEPTGLEIVRAHKGAARWVVRVRGRSAHSSRPDRGVNAIVRMARVVLCLERHHKETLTRRTHDLLGHATLSVGTISGGQAVNTVPDLCTVRIDRRLLPGETAEQALEEMREAIRRDAEIDFDVEFVKTSMDLAGLDTPEDSPVVRRAVRACERVLGRARLAGAPYGTDAAVYAAAGVSSIVLGPGDVGVAHSDHESICLDQLAKAVEVYLAIMRGE